MIELPPLKAWQRGIYEIDREVAAAVNGTGAVTATPVADERWQLEAGSSVGVLLGDGWLLRINPRLAVPRLMFLLAYSLHPDGWRDDLAPFEEAEDVVEALATGFAAHTERALEQGVLRGYVTVDDRRHDLRGRVRFGDHLARGCGLPLPLEVTYDDFSADIAENRMLRTAAEVLLLHRRIPVRARGRLMRIRAILDEATVVTDRRNLVMPRITPLNARYASALALSRLILSHTSVASRTGDVTTTCFLFDMNEVFESFVWTALRESLRHHGGVVERQAPGALDSADRPRLGFRADIVWRLSGTVRAVLDSKYKSLYATGSMPNADAYQMLAYCVGYGLRRGFLVYAKDAVQQPQEHVVKRHGYIIDVRAVDVELPPSELLREIELLGDAVVDSAGLLGVRAQALPRTA